MSKNVYDVLKERGYIDQSTNEDEVRELLGKEKVTFYIGFDPTADSLHVGHFIQVMVLMHMQKAGHRPIALFGGGTGKIGDPSGRNDMRQLLQTQEVSHNVNSFKRQVAQFVDFEDENGFMLDNSEWLTDLNFIEFLRDIGKHFSVNRMLSFDCFKTRLEQGLSFFEFSYMLMQAYDFLELYRKYDCKIQFGGSDQWSNIIAGVELVRKKEGATVHGLTFKLLTTSDGIKMGKTQAGALWLDPKKTSPYDFYQYWRNVNDLDVEKCLCLLTFLPMDYIKELSSLEGQEINKAKEVLAFEVTKLVHGEEEAAKAESAAKALFGQGGEMSEVPTSKIDTNKLGEIDILELLLDLNLISSKSEGRRLVEQGGIYINDNRIDDINLTINDTLFIDGELLIRKGKKKYHRVEMD